MFQNSPIIAFLATPYNQSIQKNIKGTIEKVVNDSEFILRIGGERMTIKAEKGSLQAGDIVNCTVNKNSLFLEKIIPPRNLSILKDDSFVSNFTHVPQGKVVILTDIPSQIPEGLYKFGNTAQALSFIGKNDSYDTNSSEPAYLRVISSGNKETAALLLDQKEAVKVINSWPGNFTSNALKSLNPDIFREIVELRGSLRLDNLHRIDKLLASSQLQSPQTRAGSASAQEFASAQWLKIALENVSLIETLISRFPSFSASGLAASMEETISSLQLQNDRESGISLLQKAAITPEIFNKLDKTEVIPQVATNLGYDLENQLSTGSIPVNGIKTEMLRMIEKLSSLQSSISQVDTGNNSAAAPTAMSPEEVLKTATADILDQAQKELRQLLFDKNRGLLSGNNSLSLQCSTILQQTMKQIEALLSSAGLQKFDLSYFTADILGGLSSLQSDDLPENIELLFKKIFSLIPEFSVSSETTAFAPSNINSLMGLFSEINSLEKTYQNENGHPANEFQINTSKVKTDFALSELFGKFSNQIRDIIDNFQKSNDSTPQTPQKSMAMGSYNTISPSFEGIEVQLTGIRFDILRAFSFFSTGADSTQDMLRTAGWKMTASASREIMDNFSKTISSEIFDLVQKKLSGIKLLVETINTISAQNQNLPGASESFLEKFALLQKAIPNTINPPVNQNEIVKTTLEQLDSFLSDINKFAFSSGKSVAGAVNDLSLKGAAPQVLRSVEIHLSDILNRLTSRLNETIEKIGNIKSDIEHLTRSTEAGLTQNNKFSNVSDHNENISSQSQTALKPEDSSLLRQIPGRQLENLLTRLESLQLLSRQVPSSSGEQQILALPMRIGNEWTEVNIRFVKDHSTGKTAGNKRHFSVMLNVAPSRLGAIEITMEYEFKKFLKLNMEFESRETGNWFSSQRETLKDAIKELGIPLTQFELHVRTPELSTETGETISDKGNFDIRI